MRPIYLNTGLLFSSLVLISCESTDSELDTSTITESETVTSTLAITDTSTITDSETTTSTLAITDTSTITESETATTTLVITDTSTITGSETTTESTTQTQTNTEVVVQNSEASIELVLNDDFVEGQTITVIPNISDENGLTEAEYIYTWFVDNNAIDTNTTNSLILNESHIGQSIYFTINFIDDDGFEESATSDTNIVVMRANRESVVTFVFDGNFIEDQSITLTPSITDEDGIENIDLSYEWFADDIAIESNSTNSLLFDSSHINQDIYVIVSFSDDRGHMESVQSDSTTVVISPNRDAQFDVSLSGEFEEQQSVVVTADITDADAIENATLVYSWYFDGELIETNTTNEISLLPADNGKEVNFEITFTDDRGNLETYTSDYYLVANKIELTAITSNELEVFAGKSNDFGANWSFSDAIMPVEFDTVSDQEIEMYDIYAASDDNGNIIAVMTEEYYEAFGSDTDVIYTYSNDNGASFSEIQLINPDDTVDSGSSVDARIVTDKKGTWVAIWNSNDDIGNNGTDNDIVFAISTNNGESFSAPQTLNPESLTDGSNIRDSGPSLAMEDNIWTVVWTSYLVIDGDVGTDRDVVFSYSEDQGATWSATGHINSWAASDISTDYFPIIDMNSNGFAVTAWSGHDGTNDLNVFVATSMDFGKTWSDAVLINQYAEFDGTSDHDYPTSVLVTEDNIAIISWEGETQVYGSDSDLFYSVSTDLGLTWSIEQGFNPDFDTDSGNDSDLVIKQASDGTWIGYYQDQATRNSYMRTSDDLENWSDPILVTDDSNDRASIVIH